MLNIDMPLKNSLPCVVCGLLPGPIREPEFGNSNLVEEIVVPPPSIIFRGGGPCGGGPLGIGPLFSFIPPSPPKPGRPDDIGEFITLPGLEGGLFIIPYGLDGGGPLGLNPPGALFGPPRATPLLDISI